VSPDTYTECHLLLAVMNEDWEEANRLLSGMSQPERHRLMEHARVLRAGIIDGRFDGYDNQPVLPRAIHGDEPA
jgi:hypothetical protein